ncbi:Alpha/Beta hydrolase protein [Radiomyces spectabilis]|uniref:Alpha/Beta hydrolase protein n=1 Tax=Radiomyces spectabilis TaxID=64574 RepID=UPI00221FE3CC|nr:Alpha/Beta hydrolase protein [Radiomyces spectabilis]KAI8379508.1 Alpha/Beta hydrolase protein [Radiomyces spectabilis]
MTVGVRISTHLFGRVRKYNELDLYVPPNANQCTPLLVFIHGGAWRSEDKADHAQLAMYLAVQGYTVAVVNYRLSLRNHPHEQPEVQHPDHIDDILDAIHYLIQTPPRSAVYDTTNIHLIGHSCGAHMAMMIILDPASCLKSIRGVIGADGIYDIPLLLQTFPDYTDFIEQAFGTDTSQFVHASPISKFAQHRLPPVLIVHSLEDSLVDLGQAKVMLQHLLSLDAKVQLDTSARGDHYDMLKTPEFIRAVKRFV